MQQESIKQFCVAGSHAAQWECLIEGRLQDSFHREKGSIYSPRFYLHKISGVVSTFVC